MGLRAILAKYSVVVTIAALGVLTLAAVTAVRRITSPPDNNAPDKTLYYFVDPESGQLHTLSTTASPAFIGRREAFRAYVYTCGVCSEQASLFVGYMEKLSPQRIEKEAQMRAGLAPGEDLRPAARAQLQELRGQHVSALSPVEWVETDDPKAAQIAASIQGKCPSGTATPCVPGQP